MAHRGALFSGVVGTTIFSDSSCIRRVQRYTLMYAICFLTNILTCYGDSEVASFVMKEARACSRPRLINSFFVFSSTILPAAGACLRRRFSFSERYFSTSSSINLYSSSGIWQSPSAFEIWLWTVFCFDMANTWTASCLAALAAQRRDTTTPARSSRPAAPVMASSVQV